MGDIILGKDEVVGSIPTISSSGVSPAGKPSVTSVTDGIFLPRSRKFLIFIAVPVSEFVQTAI